jgi:hypothetical protein
MAGKTYTKMLSGDLKGEAKKQDSLLKYNQRIAKANIHYKMIEIERQRKEKKNEA